jgi:predicted ATPase
MSAIQVAVFEMQLKIEHNFQPEQVIILDGALPGSLSWYRAFGLNPNEILNECFHHRYASVFIFDPLPYKENGARDEDAPIVDYFDEWLARDYYALGYSVIRVPVMSIQNRLNFVLERLSEKGKV